MTPSPTAPGCPPKAGGSASADESHQGSGLFRQKCLKRLLRKVRIKRKSTWSCDKVLRRDLGRRPGGSGGAVRAAAGDTSAPHLPRGSPAARRAAGEASPDGALRASLTLNLFMLPCQYLLSSTSSSADCVTQAGSLCTQTRAHTNAPHPCARSFFPDHTFRCLCSCICLGELWFSFLDHNRTSGKRSPAWIAP